MTAMRLILVLSRLNTMFVIVLFVFSISMWCLCRLSC